MRASAVLAVAATGLLAAGLGIAALQADE